MKLYRLHYGEDVKQGICRGDTGNERYSIYTIKTTMKLAYEFSDLLYELHCPKGNDFYIQPNVNSLFYFKEHFYLQNKHIFDSFILSASALNIRVNVFQVDLDKIQSYQCVYQDDSQMCINLEGDCSKDIITYEETKLEIIPLSFFNNSMFLRRD